MPSHQEVKAVVTVEEQILMMLVVEEVVLELLDLMETQVEMEKEMAVQQMEIFTYFHMQEGLEEGEARQIIEMTWKKGMQVLEVEVEEQ
jgi:hypothetical protein